MAEPCLPAEWVADIVGLSATRYGQWVGFHILREAGYGKCTEAHAFEAAVAVDLRTSIKSRTQLKMALNRLRPALSVPNVDLTGPIDVVWDKRRKVARWAYDDHELADAVRDARDVTVVAMGERLRAVRSEFRRLVDERVSSTGAPKLRVIRGQAG